MRTPIGFLLVISMSRRPNKKRRVLDGVYRFLDFEAGVGSNETDESEHDDEGRNSLFVVNVVF